MKQLNIIYVGVDGFNLPVFKHETEKRYYCSVEILLSYGENPNFEEILKHELYFKGNDFDSEPDYPINSKKDIEINIINKNDFEPPSNQSFDYMMLDMLRSKLDYYYGYGNKSPNCLKNGNLVDHINSMKEIYNKLTIKPVWLTLEQIKKYENDNL